MTGDILKAEKPYVTSMIVVRNEEKYIAKCLHSLLVQDYPADRYEIIIVDGESTDKTVEEAKEEIERVSSQREIPTVRIVSNPKHILASGWNIGIKEAKGEYVIRPDAHAYVEEDFISKNVEVMLTVKDAACVGGTMTTISDTKTGEIIKEALSCPFGVGGAKFRYVKEPGYVDTVAYGLYKKNVFDEIGYFNEALVRTQDNDLHRRMRAAGMKFYLDPAIQSYYYSRNTYRKLSKQQFNNGKWTMINFLLRPGKMSVRHFIPFGFVVGIFATVIGGFIFRPIWVLTLLAMILHICCGFVFAARRTRILSHILVLPAVFLLMHFSYGLGSISGMFAKRRVLKDMDENKG